MKISYVFSNDPSKFYYEDFDVGFQSRNVEFYKYCKIVLRNGKYFITLSEEGKLDTITHIIDIAKNEVTTSEIELTKYYLIFLPDENYEEYGVIVRNSKAMIFRLGEDKDMNPNYNSIKNNDQDKIKEAFDILCIDMAKYYRKIRKDL